MKCQLSDAAKFSFSFLNVSTDKAVISTDIWLGLDANKSIDLF